jgi:hypothetical protein
MVDKVKLEHMTDEAWAHELARCRFVMGGNLGHRVRHAVRCQRQYSGEERHRSIRRADEERLAILAVPCDATPDVYFSPKMGERDAPPSMA